MEERRKLQLGESSMPSAVHCRSCPAAPGFLSQAQIPKVLENLEERPGFLLWKVFPNAYPALFPVPTDFLTSHFIPLFQGQNLTAVTGQIESGWPFKATFSPPRAVWLGWRR